MNIELGDRILFLTPILNFWGNEIHKPMEFGTVAQHPHEKYPRLIVEFDNGGWGDLEEDFARHEWMIVSD